MHVTLPDSVEPEHLKIAAIVALVVLGIITLWVLRFVRKMVFRVIFAGVLLAAGILVYVQRDDLDRCQKDIRTEITATNAQAACTCTFVGVEVTVPRCPALAPAPDG